MQHKKRAEEKQKTLFELNGKIMKEVHCTGPDTRRIVDTSEL